MQEYIASNLLVRQYGKGQYLPALTNSFNKSFIALLMNPDNFIDRGGGRSAKLVRPFEKSLDQTIIGPTKILKM